MTVGLIYYADDPHKRVFRYVYPVPGDPPDVLDNPDPAWLTEGLDGARPAVMDKAANANGRKRGSPLTPANEPVVYLINFGLLTEAQQETANAFIAAQPTWMNIIHLGDGDPTAILSGVTLISPSWVAVIDGSVPSLGAPTRQRNFSGHTVRVWQV